jgi:tRNA-2-methylthio-N6-dimethylallyladenosine synthase
MKKFFIKTHGCQMNVNDSERMSTILHREGYAEAKNEAEADVIVMNTCHIREKASDKMYSALGRYAALQKDEDGKFVKSKIVAVTGCVAQAEGEQIFARSKTTDMVIGPHAYHKLPEYLAKAEKGEKTVATDFTEEEKFKIDAIAVPAKRSAFLTVQEGCDKFCTFCVVPYTRGAEYSRKFEDLMAEARRLADQGVREITLLGQNVNAYHGVDASGKIRSLADVIEKIAGIKEIFRIRYTTSHPNDMTEDLIAAHRDIKKLSPYLHLPVQSGSDRILKAMNRKHTVASYHAVIEKIRKAQPNLALSSDFIVGFPGESDQDFEDTMRLAAEIGFASSFSFKYSPRPGTPAAAQDAQIPETVKTERLARLQALLLADQERFNRESVGKFFDIIIEKPGRRAGQWIGKSPYLQSVAVETESSAIGALVRAEVVSAGQNSLIGKYLHEIAV